jgi:hypothetical protein
VIGVWMPFLAAAAIAQAAGQAPAAHAAHTPAHGGVFTAAAGDTLHLEGVYPLPGRFRLYIADVRGRALTPARRRALSGRIVDGDREVAPLALSGDGHYFEAQVEPQQPPVTVTVALRSIAGRPDERLTFTFARFSDNEPATFVLPPTLIPKTLPGIVALLRIEARESRALIEGTSSRGVYVAIARVRDLALALDRYVATLAAGRRARADTAIRAAVRASWLLHVAADEGMPFQTRMAAEILRDAIDELLAALAGTRSLSGV